MNAPHPAARPEDLDRETPVNNATDGPGNRPPFARFFLLASLDAAAGVGVLLPYLLAGVDPIGAAGESIFAWHGREMVFGYGPCVCTGFLLTALPRWTGRAAGRLSEDGLLALWLAGRIAFLLPAAFGFLIAAPLAGLAAVISIHVVAARDWRDLKVIALLWLSAAGAIVATIPDTAGSPQLGWRIGVAASIGLMMVVGGRIAASVTASLLTLRRGAPPPARSPAIERTAGAAAAVGLLVWLADPDGTAMAAAGAVAAAAQLVRLAQWRGWLAAGAPSVFIFHAAYVFIPLGFALFALRAVRPDLVPESAALHAWTAGGMGVMTLGVMGSMIRRWTGRSFAPTHAAALVFLFGATAAATRLKAGFADDPTWWLAAAAAAWIAAFGLFLFDFRTPLLTFGRRG